MTTMFDPPLAIILMVYLGLVASSLLACVIGAGIYNLREAKRHYERTLHPYSRQNRLRAKISVVIYYQDQASSVGQTLDSLRQNKYKHYEVIVVDNSHSSQPALSDEIAAYKNRFPKLSLRLTTKHKKFNPLHAITTSIKQWTTGDIILTLAAGSVVHEQALHNINRHFQATDIQKLIPNITFSSQPSILSIFQQFDEMLRGSARKLLSTINLSQPTTGGMVMVYRHKVSRALLAAPVVRYASDVQLECPPIRALGSFLLQSYDRRKADFKTTEVVASWRHMLWVQIVKGVTALLGVLTLFVITYLLYLALYFKQSTLYGLTWLIFSGIATCVVWGKDSLRMSQRLRLSVFIPVLYGLWYFYTGLQLLSFALLLPVRLLNHSTTKT